MIRGDDRVLGGVSRYVWGERGARSIYRFHVQHVFGV